MSSLRSIIQSLVRKTDVGFSRFLLVGGTGLVVNNLCLLLFVDAAGLHYLLGATLATQCSTLWNFTLTELWVFEGRDPSRSLMSRLLRFYAMNNLALLLRGPLLALMVSALGLHYLAANLISLFISAAVRYLLSSQWIWVPQEGTSNGRIYAYDIHGILAIESAVQLPELEYFRVPALTRSPDMRLREERRRTQRPSDQAIYYQDGLGKYGFEISIAHKACTEIQVSPLVKRSPHVLYTNVFEPLLRWAFVRKGYALVHAACIASTGKSLLITAKTDTGKTTTILRALDGGSYAFLSDDMTILGRDGRLLNYPKPLTISAHTLQAVRDARLQPRERVLLQFQSRLHSRTGRRFAFWLTRFRLPASTINAIVQILVPPPKYTIRRLIPEVTIRRNAQLTHLVELARGREGQQPVSLNEMVNRLIRNAEDAYGFPPYPEIRDEISRWQGVDLHELERGIILDAVSGCRAWRLSSEEYAWWESLPELIQRPIREARPVARKMTLHELDTRPTERVD